MSSSQVGGDHLTKKHMEKVDFDKKEPICEVMVDFAGLDLNIAMSWQYSKYKGGYLSCLINLKLLAYMH